MRVTWPMRAGFAAVALVAAASVGPAGSATDFGGESPPIYRSSTVVGASRLMRTADSPSPRTRGKVERVRRTEDIITSDIFLVGRVLGLAPSTNYEIYVEDEEQSPEDVAYVMEYTGSFRTGPRGVGRFNLYDVFPLPERRSVARFEIRDASGRAVLLGAVPARDSRPIRVSGPVIWTKPGVEGTVRVDWRQQVGVERMAVVATLLEVPEGTTVDFVGYELAPGSTSSWVESVVGSTTTDRLGRVKFVLDTRTGDPLPMGASSIAELQSKWLILRVAGENVGTVAVPQLWN